MPLAIVLDTSLSMSRPVGSESEGLDDYQRRHLAVHGINLLLDHLSTHSRLEFVALITFSSYYEVQCSFTRDYDAVRAKLATVEERDKTVLEAALHGVSALVSEEWGLNTCCHVVLVTDGSAGLNVLSLSRRLLGTGVGQGGCRPTIEEPLPLPFPFPVKLHIVALAGSEEPCLTQSLPLYHKLVELSGGDGGVATPEGATLSLKSVSNLFVKLAETHFSAFQATLSSATLSDTVILFPAPQDRRHVNDLGQVTHCKISKELTLCGFVDLLDVASPPAVSRHLVLPIHSTQRNAFSGGDASTDVKVEDAVDELDISAPEEGKNPSFCVLLHGALKVENMGALCRVGHDWYGLLYSWADSKKKSNLMLSIFEPGTKCIPWLGDLSQLGPLNEAPSPSSYGSFPVKPNEKRSYAQSCVVWVQQSGLQTDIQKILRHARKMPEKTQHFYKELNRLRRAAMALGFTDLMETMALVLERECTLLPPSAHPDCALQLTNATSALRTAGPQARDLRINIVPLRTKYSHDD